MWKGNTNLQKKKGWYMLFTGSGGQDKVLALLGTKEGDISFSGLGIRGMGTSMYWSNNLFTPLFELFRQTLLILFLDH